MAIQRGRKSAAALSVVIEGQFGTRPVAPSDLTEQQKAIWAETVASEPADVFATAVTKGLLKDYCRHRAAAEGLAVIIDTFQPEWLKTGDGVRRYGELLKIRDAECRAAATKATKLRLTNQARYTPQAAATASRNALKTTKPWEI